MILDVYVIVAATDACGCVEGDWPDEDFSEVFVGRGNKLCLPSIAVPIRLCFIEPSRRLKHEYFSGFV